MVEDKHFYNKKPLVKKKSITQVRHMKRFLLLFIGKELKATDDTETKKYMDQWQTWMGKLKEDGNLKGGMPLTWRGKMVNVEGASEYQPQDIDIGGYMILEADSEEKAVAIAQDAPNIALGGAVIVRPCLSV
jgi:hypothetical protein